MITVIIPVYKVEAYLRTCVDSVLAQTYSDLEILLVDDGSPDNCPTICDEYAAKDPRIRVIHKENGGLSDARNAGLDVARGNYIAFADSDDWMNPRMLETLYDAMQRTDSEIAVCNFYYANEQSGELTLAGVEQELILNQHDAVCLLLKDDELQNYVWNKLFAAHLWQDVRFPVGQAFEDINTTWKLFRKAQRTVLLDTPGYYYRVRSGSIVQSQSIKNEIDCVLAGLERYDALADLYPDCAETMAFNIMCTITKVWGLAWDNRPLLRAKFQPQLERFASFAKIYLKAYSPTQDLGITGRLTLRLLPYAKIWAYWLAHVLHKIYLLKHPPLK